MVYDPSSSGAKEYDQRELPKIKMTSYNIEEGTDLTSLKEAVEVLLDNGYELAGGIAVRMENYQHPSDPPVYIPVYTQALIYKSDTKA